MEMNDTASLESIHTALGARFTEVAGRVVPRNYGDAAAEYAAVRESAGVADRADRALIRLYGRDPVRMIQGLVTNDVARAPAGQGVYAALLTPKGKMIADLRVFRRADGGVLLALDAGALEGTLAHLRKFVPPLFARIEELDDALGVLGVYGPRARQIIAQVFGDDLPEGMAEDAFVMLERAGAEALVARTGDYGEDGYDLTAPRAALAPLWRALVDEGARPVGFAALDVLRIETGRPRWGAELDESVLPIEAGLRERAISQTKGCYTGQEVITRILHRGHVNRHLRGLLLGDAPVPTRDTELYRAGDEKPVGRITSACESPLYGQTIALGYVRREVEPPSALRLGGPAGPEVEVVELPIPVRS